MVVQILKCQSQLETVAALSLAVDFNRATAVDKTLVSLIMYGVFVAFRPKQNQRQTPKAPEGNQFSSKRLHEAAITLHHNSRI